MGKKTKNNRRIRVRANKRRKTNEHLEEQKLESRRMLIAHICNRLNLPVGHFMYDFRKWLRTTNLSEKDGLRACLKLAKSGKKMPWASPTVADFVRRELTRRHLLSALGPAAEDRDVVIEQFKKALEDKETGDV